MCAALTVVWIGSRAWPLASASRLSLAIAACAWGERTSAALNDHHGRRLGAREGLLDLVVGAHDRDARAAGRRRRAGWCAGRGPAARRRPAARRTGSPRAPESAGPGAAAHPIAREVVAGLRTRPFSTLSPSLPSSAGRTVSEPTIAHEHDEHRADPDRVEHLGPRQQHPGHRDQHGDPGGEHRAAGGGGRATQRVRACMPGAPLLALALEIEQRVVDADGHPHQQHHGAGRFGGVDEVARDRGQAVGAQHRGEREQHRQAGCDERSEGDQQHQERDRQREALRTRQAIVGRLAQFELCARLARTPRR